MEPYEATKIVFQRIQSLDPENASKIMGVLLIQDHGEKEMIRLAFGPESLLHSAILKARKELGLVSSVTTPTTPPLSPFNNSSSLSRQNSFSSTSSRLLGGVNLPSPLSVPNQSSTSWSSSSFVDFQVANDLSILKAFTGSSSSSTMNAAASPFYTNKELDLVDELQLQDQLSFLNDFSSIGPKSNDLFCQDLAKSPRTGSDPVFFPSYNANWNGAASVHRRSLSVSDIYTGSDDLSAGLEWKRCLYFSRGHCKNGTSCHFLHGSDGGIGPAADGGTLVGSQSKFEMLDPCQDLLRSKSTQQQRLAAASQLMVAANCSYSSLLPNKCMNVRPEQQFPADNPRAVMMGDGICRSNRERFEREDCHGMGMASPGSSRQIYLTFPADSTFKEEDVSSYFSIFGPVQDVRIPYQQKRMFGFVTFDYPETVKLIFAKGNPHFVCDARVLVKPYKEKGKIVEKHRKQQQIEMGDYTGCGSPTGLDMRNIYDLQHGARILYNSPDLLWRMKLEEQADLHLAIELQNRRLMGLQLPDVKRNSLIGSLSTGAVLSSPKHLSVRINPDIAMMDHNIIEAKEEGKDLNPFDIATVEAAHDQLVKIEETDHGKGKENLTSGNDAHQSFGHNLPDSPFASPEAARIKPTVFTNGIPEIDRSFFKPATTAGSNLITCTTIFAPTSAHDIGPFKSCYFQVPKFASGHETIGI